MRAFVRANKWSILTLAVFLLLKVPALFDPFTYGDEGIYLTLGQAARKGLVWYRDIHDNKPPLLYLVAALSNNFFTYRVIHVAWSLVTLIAFWRLAKLVFPKNIRAWRATTIFFAVFTSLPFLEGNVGNAENYMMLPTIAGFYLLYEGLVVVPPQKKPFGHFRDVLCFSGIGFLFGLAALFKIPAVFDFAAALAFAVICLDGKKLGLPGIAHRLSLLTIGFLFPILISLTYYFARGGGKEYLAAAFAQNLPYLSSWTAGQHQSGGLPLALMARTGLVALLALFLFFKGRKLPEHFKLILVWFGFAWFAALLSSRPYPHYLLQIVPPLALSLGLFFSEKRIRMKLVPFTLGLTLGLTFIIFGFWRYPNLDYYRRFGGFLTGRITLAEYHQQFDPASREIYEIAAYLKTRTFPDERIFIWGTRPSIYALSERLPVGRFTASYHIIDFGGQTETLEEIKKDKTRFLIVSADETRPFPEFFAVLKKDYLFEKEIGAIKIFHRKFTAEKSEDKE